MLRTHPTAAWGSLVVGALLLASAAPAQEAPARSGVRGRVVVAPELLDAEEWVVDAERAQELRGPARIRRPAGRGPVLPLTEPLPSLVVALEGVRKQAPDTTRLVLEGMRFVPRQAVLSRGDVLAIENRQAQGVTVVGADGAALAEVMPGQTKEVVLEGEGVQVLSLKEMPFATATVRVLGPARFLRWEASGEIPPVEVPEGEYKLAFYHGAKALRVQPLTVPEEQFVAIDATVSANGVVTVSLKDGNLQVAVPQQPIAPPSAASPGASARPTLEESAAGTAAAPPTGGGEEGAD